MSRRSRRLPDPAPKAPPRTIAIAGGLDALAILVFAAVGRAAHHEEHPVLGVFATAWPFLAAAAAGWLIFTVWRAPFQLWSHGVLLWFFTWGAGIALRVVTGSTAQISFIIVAGISLAVLMLGWRAIAALVLKFRPAAKTAGLN